ncbi:MAG: TIGR01666 family membrane protein [Flavobacteriaceae bacterium]|nr:MAG: TIGR01666 family membrane protein [Flavobacteriaceae bacterium]
MKKTSPSTFISDFFNESLRRNFWRYPVRMRAFKASASMALLCVPFVLLGYSNIGITLALGALAGALSETNDHPKGRLKALMLTVASFIVASLSVVLLGPYPVLFAIGLVGSTITFIVIGGLSDRYRGISFGAVLIIIYTMLGVELSPVWYHQPLFLPLGALFYGVISLGLLYLHPFRLLEEELANAYQALAVYMREKAKLFPSDARVQTKIRNRLAVLNIQVVNSLEESRKVMNSYENAVQDLAVLRPYLQKFILVQSLHERAASSHEKYDVLSQESHNTELMEGLGQLLIQLSFACTQFADNLLTRNTYKHPVALTWTVKALEDQIASRKDDLNESLILLYRNLKQSHKSLKNLNYNMTLDAVPRIKREERSVWVRLKEILSWNHPRLRYAIRLSVCFLLGYILIQFADLAKGEWVILTSLFVCQPSYSETRKRLFQRIIGTIIGVVGGILVVQLVPTVMGQLCFLSLASYLFFIYLRKNYAIAVIFITCFVIAAFNLISNEGVAMMGPRLIDTIIGATLAILVVRLLWPDWQHKKLPGLLAKALEKNTLYFRAIVQEYHKASTDDLSYREARFNAHQADNALTLAWQGMKMEPKRHQQSQELAFKLTYLNHALVSYLSAFGAHRTSSFELTEDVERILYQVDKALDKTTHYLKGESSDETASNLPYLLNKLSNRLDEMERGSQRQKMVLLYNIAEVTKQLSDDANKD